VPSIQLRDNGLTKHILEDCSYVEACLMYGALAVILESFTIACSLLKGRNAVVRIVSVGALAATHSSLGSMVNKNVERKHF
jgi:hypothetical protein